MVLARLRWQVGELYPNKFAFQAHRSTSTGFMTLLGKQRSSKGLVNPEKSRYMVFGLPPPNRPICLGHMDLQATVAHQYLGVWPDLGLTFWPHVHYVRDRMQVHTKVLQLLSWRSFGASVAVKRHFYTAAIRSVADYCAPYLPAPQLRHAFQQPLNIKPDGEWVHAIADAAWTLLIKEALWLHLLVLLQHTEDQQATTINVFNDSLAALQSLSQIMPKDNRFLLSQIQRSLQTLHRLEKSTSFHWVPEHIGFAGNKSADVIARRAAQGLRSTML
ncbi:hypothetical protein Pcinc_004474 [Petrolisthes cinctipes]|uniref:RNase H type-1 domain-containing protein n=1 Tax=Petrolisthes cinctipes TaxID=88211 RepID=A0AAE1GGS6_PETCI|nr:hypothetical protein Pcinc_004474 [Petrolisthes cinctipes]